MQPRLIIYSVSLLCLGWCQLTTADEHRPNVIVILADDMGVDSVSHLNSRLGLQTKAVDRLAREGITFNDAHSTSAVCSPTRYSVLTGRYNWRSRLKKGIVGQWERPLIENDRLTIAEMFRLKGYRTACIGKWHLGWNWPKLGGGTTTKRNEIDFNGSISGGPVEHGFDSYFGDDVPNWPPYAWRENDRLIGQISTTMTAGALIGVGAGPAVKDWDFRAVLQKYTQKWHDYIVAQSETPEPFFLYASMPSPHTPIAPHEDFVGRSGVSEYADFLLQTDHAVQRILDALDETNQTENTVVFFTCDNGTSPKADFERLAENGVHLNVNWRGWKADAYEGGHRVPFVVRWPDHIAAGQRSKEAVTLADIMATCADIIDYPLAGNAAEDSVSLLSVLKNQPVQTPVHEFVVHHSISGHFAVRKGPWKLLLCAGSGGWSPPREAVAQKQKLPAVQLYHLDNDPKETTNLQAEHPEIVESLTSALAETIARGRSVDRDEGRSQALPESERWWPQLPWPRPADQVERSGIEGKQTATEGTPFRYLLFPPKVVSKTNQQPMPLVLFLHGGGEGGADLQKVRKHGPPQLASEGQSFPFFLVAPQNPSETQFWDDQQLIALVDELMERYPIDPDRVYLTGLSRGAYGAWRLAIQNPDRFAAVVPVCGGGPLPYVQRLKNVPLWVFHGARDPVIPLSESKRLVDALKAAGSEVKWTVYPDAGHDAWTQTYSNPEVFDWMLKQKRIPSKE